MAQPGLKSGPISADELVQKLAASRKIMNKVDTGDYQKGNINEDILTKAPEELSEMMVESQQPQRKGLGLPVGVPSVEKIRGSKLPDAIKTAMIEKPIPVPDISLNEGLDINLVNKARRLMEEDGSISSSSKRAGAPSPIPQRAENIRIESVDEKKLETLIENIIRKVLDEKLTQILTAQHMGTINESLAIKVGDSIFTGKITKVKTSK